MVPVTPSGSVTVAVSGVPRRGTVEDRGSAPASSRSVTVTVTSLVTLALPSEADTVTEYMLSVPMSDGVSKSGKEKNLRAPPSMEKPPLSAPDNDRATSPLSSGEDAM